MRKIYVNTQIEPIDVPLKEEFAELITVDRDEAGIMILSKKSVEPGDITQLAAPEENRRIMLLVDNKDTELIAEAKAAGVKDIFYSPVKLPPLIERIKEALAQDKPGQVKPNAIKPAEKPDTAANANESKADKTDELNALLQTIKSRMVGSGELEALRKENHELKDRIKKYENFISVLKEIFVQEG